ncbi:IS630 family transposase [Paucibacter sp. B51]|uniref:IS630 family transposase n=1 Tax=Paucibacter sp. B51 TaxID=2993315 RepID=UPI0022EC0FC1|nr:IS630 family transposase [Paucibacter sp. B51]
MYSNPAQWRRLRTRVLVNGESMRSVAKCEGMSRNTLKRLLALDAPPRYRRANMLTKAPAEQTGPPRAPKRSDIELQRWKDWLYSVEGDNSGSDPLGAELAQQSGHARKLVLAAMARKGGFSERAIAEHLALARGTVRTRLAAFRVGGVSALLERKPRPRKADDPLFISALFALLHEPPALSGYNRTTWRLADLQESLARRGASVSKGVIRQAIQAAGFKWRSAKVVLTSTDPEYREKLDHVQSVLSNLADDERFFSIDEFGPFAVKAKPGRLLAAPGEYPSVPQWQKSKGWLILTAALELSRNRVTHFYSRAKNTQEMTKMAELLIEEYRDVRTVYLSWDAASWHMSKELLAFIEKHNANGLGLPKLELVPLPASAQFLNVIESVFSGMARAIIHSSDYPSVDAARAAIDRYFADRNRHFAKHPKRAGSKIWGKERTAATFDPSNNCKDAAYR